MEAAQPVAEASNETTVLTPEPQPVYAQPAFAQPTFTQPAKKKKSPLAWLIPVIAVIAVVGVAAALLMGPLKGWFTKSFGSEEDYRDYVQQSSQDTTTNALSNAYGAALDALSGETAVGGATDVSVKIQVGNKVISLLEDLTQEELGKKLDMDWAKSIELKLSANAKDGLQQIGAALNISDKKIAALDCILNLDKGQLFVTAVDMTEQYLKVDFKDAIGADASVQMLTSILQDPALVKALPTEKELNDLLDKYIAIVMDNLDNVEKSTETVKVGQLQQNLTLLKTTIDTADARDAMEDVLETLYTDQQVEQIIRKVAGFLESHKELNVKADDVYNNFKNSIKTALDEMKANPENSPTEEIAVLTEYVNDSHEIVGYAFAADGEEAFRFVELKNGNQIASQLTIAKELSISGEGTEKDGAVTAQYDVIAEEKKLLTISLVDFKTKDAPNGKIRIAPSSELLQEAGLSSTASSAIDLAKLQLELDFASSNNSASFALNALSGEELLAGLVFASAEKEATAITEPTNTCDVAEIETWLGTIDAEKITTALKDAGLPIDEVVQLIMGNAAA